MIHILGGVTPPYTPLKFRPCTQPKKLDEGLRNDKEHPTTKWINNTLINS
jgi:hypothetical protein